MIITTLLGIVIIYIIQLLIFRKENSGTLKDYIESKQLLIITKEFLVVLLSATIALNITNVYENYKTKEKVKKLLAVAENEVEKENGLFESLLSLYEEKKMDGLTIKANCRHDSSLIESVLKNDTVLTTVSPLMYSALNNDVRNAGLCYESLSKVKDDKNIIIAIEGMKSHNENIIWEIDSEINHLSGKISENELMTLYEDYMDSKYIRIEPPE